MAIRDLLTRLSDAQAVTADADSTNYYDAGAAGYVGRGEPMCVVVTIDVAADFTTGDETYQFNLETDDNTSFSSGTVIANSTVINGDELTAGTQVVIDVPQTNEQYMQLQVDVSGTTPSVTFTADIVPKYSLESASDAYYPSGFTVS